MCLFDLGLHDSATLHQPISFFTALAGVLSLCSVGCTWPLLHLMAFFQVQLSLLTASFKRMRSFSQSQELNRDPAHWYQSSNIIQAGCPWVQQEGAGSKRLCVYWGQDIEDRKVHLSGWGKSHLPKGLPLQQGAVAEAFQPNQGLWHIWAWLVHYR